MKLKEREREKEEVDTRKRIGEDERKEGYKI